VRFADNTFFVDDGSRACHFPEPGKYVSGALVEEIQENSQHAGPSAAMVTFRRELGHFPDNKELDDLRKQGRISDCMVLTVPKEALVSIDGEEVGITPVSFELMRHGDTPRVVAVSIPGYRTIEKRIVPDGKQVLLELRLEEVPAEEPGPIETDSRAAPSPPAGAASVIEGGHALTPQVMDDLVKTGQASQCAVLTTPPGAEVFVDGNRFGVSPLVFTLLMNGASERIITIKMAGYKTVEKKLVPDGKSIPLMLTLEKNK